MRLNEEFNLKIGDMPKNDGTTTRVVYIDSVNGDDTYQYRNDIKTKFKANWLGKIKKWGWFVNDNNYDRIYNDFIVPCAKYLAGVETTSDGNAREYTALIDSLIKKIEEQGEIEVIDTASQIVMSTQEITSKLADYKQQLVDAVDDEDFKKKLEPIIRFRTAQGSGFSFINSILIWIQDPKATLVKSKTGWSKFNKTVKPGSPALAAWVPYGVTKAKGETRKKIIADYLAQVGKKTEKELNPGEKEILNKKLSIGSASGFAIRAAFYDVRYTEQMEGKEDLVGSNDTSQLPWFDESGEENSRTMLLYDALLYTIKQSGVKLSFSQDLGGARGVSKSGSIEVLKNIPRNAGSISTLVHEFTHELLHQKYLKEKDKDSEWAQFFVGTKEGRGAVEQQAELSAYIVMKIFGYDMPTAINYMGLWGMNKDNAVKAFDMVASVANFIVNKIMNYLDNEEEPVTESVNEDENIQDAASSKTDDITFPDGPIHLTGMDVADMVGLGDVYDQSLQAQRSVSECIKFNSRLMLIK